MSASLEKISQYNQSLILESGRSPVNILSGEVIHPLLMDPIDLLLYDQVVFGIVLFHTGLNSDIAYHQKCSFTGLYKITRLSD